MNRQQWIATPTRTRAIMEAYQIKMKKSLGQNFLVEPNILQKMVDTAKLSANTTVIEIGPGIGALTEFLAHSAKQVYAFEIDQRFVDILKETLSLYSNVTIVPQDILTVDFSDEKYEALQTCDELVVVANLPYYITTPIIMKLIQSRLPFNRLVMLMQKEVAERMTAKVNTKSYNSLTLAIQNTMEASIEFIVPKTVFIPQPNVDSAVLKLSRRQQPIIWTQNLTLFHQMIQIAFTQRRKTIWNNLRQHTKELDVSIEQIEKALHNSEIDKSRRAESLTLEEYGQLYQSLYSQEVTITR